MVPYVNSPGLAAAPAKRYIGAAQTLLSKYAPSAPTSAAPPSTTNNNAGSSTTGPNLGALSDPDFYMKLINGDPLYKQTGLDLSASGVGDAAQTGSQIARAFAQRGIVPDLTSSAGELGLSPQVVDWIRKNVDLGSAAGLAKTANDSGVSQEAQLLSAHNTTDANIRNSLAARGLVGSGALASLLGTEEKSYTQGRYTADQQLADYVQGAYKAFADAEQARQGQLRQAAEDAANRQATIFGSTPPPAGSPTPPPPTDTPPPGGAPTVEANIRDLLMRAAKTHQNIAI